MPATRRSRTSSGPITKGGQKSLSFNQSKITKPQANSKDEKKKSLPASTLLPTVDVGHVSSESAVAAQAAAELNKAEPSPEELRAASITDAQIARYWRAREAERRTPRVHLEGVSVEERILRLFDMSSQYGVCIPFLLFLFLTHTRIYPSPLSPLLFFLVSYLHQLQSYLLTRTQPAIGIARMKRWVRANKLGLAPPIEVLAVLLKEEKKKNPRIERAYVDELLSSIAVAGGEA